MHNKEDEDDVTDGPPVEGEIYTRAQKVPWKISSTEEGRALEGRNIKDDTVSMGVGLGCVQNPEDARGP